MKKLLALVLALVMVFSVTVVASASPIKLEKHPYEEPNRELPYYHYETVPDSINLPSYKVTTDWDANGINESTGTMRGTMTVAFDTSKDATVVDIIKNMKVINKKGEPVPDDKVSWNYNTKTGKLELKVEDVNFLKKMGEFSLQSIGTKRVLKDGKLVDAGTVDYTVNFKWNDKTDKADVVGTEIQSDIYDYSKDGVQASTVEYYANGNPKSVTIWHIDTNHVAGVEVGTDEFDHAFQVGRDEDHTDHRYAEATFYYTEKGKLDYYTYWTEDDGKDAITENNFCITATGDVMRAYVNVKGINYGYYTKDYYVNVLNMDPKAVTPDMLGWFVTVPDLDSEGNQKQDEDGHDLYIDVPVAAPEGYENGFKDTVHLFATRHWYPKNTVGVVGLSLRDEYPGLTDKWINIVPVDLTVQGTQEIELVAGNMFHIGKAFVEVDGDNVTVTYSYTNNVTEAFSECVKWFKNKDEITTEFCENPTSDLVFGQPVSIANDLGGQEVALLYICNSATYYQTFITKQDAPTRYYENLKKWQNYRAGLYELMDKIPE